MSKYMHPRNIYKTPPNFKTLAIEYPEFRKHVKQELTGKVSLDFKDVEAVRALSQTLLKKDFDLDVDIPLNKLIPTIPLRLNYILWIEDLLEISKRTENIKGIDIGTGASCVYPLIASKKLGWSMLATEIDSESIAYATSNVERNSLNTKIKVKGIMDESLLKEAVGGDEYDFCMCNPPFFSSQQETIFEFKSRKQTRPRPKNAFCAAKGEVVVKGGEVEFITKLVNESRELQQKVKIYTTMVGHKVSLQPIKKLLREMDVLSFKQTEFCQGNTTRWGLAWTYCDIDLRKIPHATLVALKKQKIKHPYQYTIPIGDKDILVESVSTQIQNMFNELMIDQKLVKKSKNVIAYDIVAHSNRWSNQRRKRREQQRMNRSDDSGHESVDGQAVMEAASPKSPPCIDTATNLISDLQVRSPSKREYEDDDGYYNCKRVKLEDENTMDVCAVFLKASIIIRKDVNGLHIELIWDDGLANKDVLHQVLQYIKNNLKVEQLL